jgi:hypothetical protein
MDENIFRQLADLGMERMTVHGNSACKMHASKPVIQQLIQSLLLPEPLLVAGEMFAETFLQNRETGESVINISRDIPGFNLVFTLTTSRFLPDAVKMFPGGYLNLMENYRIKLLESTNKSTFGHWIMIWDGENIATHLSAFAASDSEHEIKAFYAWDFFSPEEMVEVYGSDMRDETIRQQWARR